MRIAERPAGGVQGCQRGFSVVELMVALAVSGIVLLTARTMFLVIERATSDVRDLATATDVEANGERFLRSLLRQIEWSADGAVFGGDTTTARFKSWCGVAAGWKERCSVRIDIERRKDTAIIAVVTSAGDALELQWKSTRASLRYIGAVGGGGTWFEHWGDGLTAPVALALVLDRDTVIMRTGAR